MNNKRIIAGFIDYLIVCIIQVIIFSLFFIKPVLESEDNQNFFNVFIRVLIITFCSLSYFVIRDIIGKRSVGKIIMKLKIVNKNDKNDAKFSKRLLRNITWLLGPVDIFAFLISQERIGDKIVGTNVVNTITENIEEKEIKQNIQTNQTGDGFAIASLVLGIVGIFFAGVLGILGFIFSFKGLRSKMKGISIIGMVLNSIQIALFIIMIILIVIGVLNI